MHQHLQNTICLAFVEVPPSFSQVEQRAMNNKSKTQYIPQRSKQNSARASCQSIAPESSVSVVRPYNNKNVPPTTDPQREQLKTAFQQHQSRGVFLPFVEEQYQQEMQQHQMYLQSSSTSRSASTSVVVPPFATNLPVPFEEVRHAYQQPYSARPQTSSSSTRASSVVGGLQQQQPRHHPEGIRIVNQNQETGTTSKRSSSVGGGSVAQHFQQQQEQQQQNLQSPKQQTQRPSSAGPVTVGNWKNHQSNIRLAGPDNTEPLQNNRVFGMPRFGGSARNNTNVPTTTTTNQVVSSSSEEKMGPSCGPTYNALPTNNPTELRKLLSQESDALRRSQRFAATPRGYPGDHLIGSGGNLRHDGQTSKTEVMNVARGEEMPPPPPTNGDSSLFHHMHRHRPKNVAHDAFVKSAPPSFEEEFKNAWQFGKKKIVAAVHVDAHRSQHVNLLQPWAANEDKDQDQEQDTVGKSISKQCKKPLSVLQNGVRSTAQQFYDKSFQMTEKVKREDLVEFGDAKSKADMKTRMLRGTTSFW